MDPKSVEATLSEWAAALEIDAAQLRAIYDEMLRDERALHPQLSTAQIGERAMRRTRIRAKREHGPMAFVSGTGMAIVLGVSNIIDSTIKLRDEATQLFRENPKMAVKMGVTDEKGVPMDTRKTFPRSGKANPFYGKPLRTRNLIQLVMGLGSFEVEGKKGAPTIFTAILDRNKPESTQPPLFHLVKFPVSGVEEDPPKENEARTARVSIPRGTGFEDAGPVKDLVALLEKHAPNLTVALPELEKWAAAHTLQDPVAVLGDVVRMDLVPNEITRNRRLQIDNGEDIKGYGTTVWVPMTVPIDFAEESKILIFGNARAGNPDSQFGASINAMGIYALEEFKIPLPEGLEPIIVSEPVAPPTEPPVEADLAGMADLVFGTGADAPTGPSFPSNVSSDAVALTICSIVEAQKLDPNGASFYAIEAFAKAAKIDKVQIEAAISKLLHEGRIYEAKLGSFKSLEIPTKDEDATYHRLIRK